MEKPTSVTAQVLENNGFKFIGFHPLDGTDTLGAESWEIHLEPFLAVLQQPSGATWIPFRCQYGIEQVRRLLWLATPKSWKGWRRRDGLQSF